MKSQDRIAKLVEQWAPAVRQAFLDAIRDLRDAVVLKRLEAEIRRGDVDGALREVGLDPAALRPLDATIRAAYEASGADAAAVITASRRTEGRLVFDVHGFRAEPWLRQNNNLLLGSILSDQGVMVRQQVGQAIARGQNPHDTALELVGRRNPVTGRRENGLIGLTSSQAEWVRNYEADLTGVPTEGALTRALRDRRFDRTVAKAIREGRPIPAETRDAMLNAYRNRALKYRAEQIAQAEGLKAIHAAQIEAYQAAADKGAIDAGQVRRYWQTVGDSRVRPEHRLIPGMNKGGVGLHEPFRTPTGPAMYPPHGFGCRCRVKMVIEERMALAA